MERLKIARILDMVAADAAPSDVDLWPIIRYQSQPKLLAARLKRRRITTVIETLVLVSLACAVVFAISPEARAQGSATLRIIGGIIYRNQVPTPSSPRVFVGHMSSRAMTLDAAKALVPFPLHIPTWVPVGYIPRDLVSVSTFPQDCTKNCQVWEVDMTWTKPWMPNQISFRIGSDIVFDNITDLITLEELTINGHPTALMVGGYGQVRGDPRNPNLRKALQWTEGSQTYYLEGGPGVAAEDLIYMAQTVP